ncbi:MAG: Fe2+ or Zn2+ uptake regulation protein [Oceanicoccus sp.]|jgi:Fe2+ or Zn2+ uptake regulation protein
MNIESIIEDLQQKGCRTTSLRMALLEILLKKQEPISAQNLMKELSARGFTPNETTVYRQLDTLVKHKVVDLVVLNPKVQLFEIVHEHHHHFVCEGCDDVQDVHSESIESAFHSFEEELARKGLSIQKHELTFFGECQSCH